VSDNPSTLLVCARPLAGRETAFADWQGRWQSALLAFADGLSVELWPAAPPDQQEVVAVARFGSLDTLRQWRRGETNRQLIEEASPLVEGGLVMQLVGQAAVEYAVTHGASMLIVTQIKPGREAAYRAWANRIQKLQASFPGFLGSFVQPPRDGEVDWTTILRFDSAANLDRWLKSDERAAMVKDSEELVGGFLAQRVDTSFPGWTPNDPATGAQPSMWKTACLVLLTLFPVIMLELRFLNPHLKSLNPAVSTFIGNIISVGLTTWPLMPLAIVGFHAWLYPEGYPRWVAWGMPLALLLAYLLEIALFWNLLL
jgi:antibiotic biosynthesis monooxygenase (ABM) superfamily enzyme